MREILFRGKQVDDGEWVEGFYFPCCFGYFPCRPAIVSKKDMDKGCWRPEEVIPETVGQYTGLTVNGKKIFEGDIVNIEYDETTVENCVVTYVGASFYGSTDFDNWELDNYIDIEVISNIHDNPELLKGGAK